MPCPKAKKGVHRAYINHLLAHPSWRRARRSKVVRKHLDNHGWITPNFAWSEMACTDGTPVPRKLKPNAIRHCWNLERFSRAMAVKRSSRKRIAISIDGPYRTPERNRQVGGASQSRHMSADGTDHYKTQVDRWRREGHLSLNEIIALAKHYFGGIGNENTGTLHLDSRPHKKGVIAMFVTWTKTR